MGLRRLDPSRWLEPDARRDEELGYKRRLLQTSRGEVLGSLPGSRPACEELLDLIREDLLTHHPQVRADATPMLGALERPDRDDLIEAGALMVQEDLCILERRGGEWVLTAACVCFPSRWRLADKLGASLAVIHGPVPGFDRDLGRPTATFFDRLAVERPVWRLNWTLLDTAELHLASPSARRASGGVVEPARSLWFRVERQTLRRLRRSGAIVFTIRTYVRSIEALLDAHPGAAAALRDTLSTVPGDVAEYKGWTGLLDDTIAWLGSRAALP